MIIKLKIQDYNNRNNMVIALANAGYKVWVEKETYLASDTYYVCFEYPEPETKPDTTDTAQVPEDTYGTYTYTGEPITGTLT